MMIGLKDLVETGTRSRRLNHVHIVLWTFVFGVFVIALVRTLVVKAWGRDGQPFELQTDGLLAICIQHEMDHLEGKLFVDYLSPLKRDRVRKTLEKARRNSAA